MVLADHPYGTRTTRDWAKPSYGVFRNNGIENAVSLISSVMDPGAH